VGAAFREETEATKRLKRGEMWKNPKQRARRSRTSLDTTQGSAGGSGLQKKREGGEAWE